MTIQPLVQVLILDSSQSGKCEARCGLDWSVPEEMKELKQSLHKLHSDTVQVEYFDLANAGVRRLYPEVVKRARQENLPLPLLVLNGKIRLSGYFDFRMLQDAIQAEMELGYG